MIDHHTTRLELITLAELVGRPPAPWLVRGVLREKSVALLYGRRGCYKSFLALDLAASIATGQAWHTHTVVQPGLVVYIAAEGGGGMVQRVRAWCETHDIAPRNVNMLFIVEPAIVRGDSDDVDVIINRIREHIEWCPAGEIVPGTSHIYEDNTAREWPVLIVIDTLARCFLGDENAQEDMGAFVQGCDKLKLALGCAILVIHHTGRDESHERGSTVLGGAMDTIYRLDADHDNQSLLLSNEKMKDGREPDPVELGYKTVEVTRRRSDDPDEELTSVVIESKDNIVALRERAILDALGCEPAGLSWAELKSQVPHIPKPSFNRYLARLTKSGQIIRENEKWLLP